VETWVERGTVRVKYLTQEHNTMSLARAPTQTALSGDKCTSHEAATPPTPVLGEQGHTLIHSSTLKMTSRKYENMLSRCFYFVEQYFIQKCR